MIDTVPHTGGMLHAPNLHTPHAYSTRVGGVSGGVYAASSLDGASAGGLNMDSRRMNGEQDDPRAVAENRQRLKAALGGATWQLSLIDQVHGRDVLHVTAATAREDGTQEAPLPKADAQVTSEPGVLLGIMTADCYALLLHDPVAGVVGAAHAGWRGTVADIAGHTVAAMQALGAQPGRIQAGISVGICAANYPVGNEVIVAMHAQQLENYILDGHADLSGANAELLRRAGVPSANIWQAGGCSTGPDYYSYRRDSGRTGRMLAVIGLAP